jgi:hypothetical protein
MRNSQITSSRRSLVHRFSRVSASISSNEAGESPRLSGRGPDWAPCSNGFPDPAGFEGANSAFAPGVNRSSWQAMALIEGLLGDHIYYI